MKTLAEKNYQRSELNDVIQVVKLFDECFLHWFHEAKASIPRHSWSYIRKKLLNMLVVAIISKHFNVEEACLFEDALSLEIPSRFTKGVFRAELQHALQQIVVEDPSDGTFEHLKSSQVAELVSDVEGITKTNIRIQVLKMLRAAILPDYVNEVLDFIAHVERTVLPDVFLTVTYGKASGVVPEAEWTREQARSFMAERAAAQSPAHQRKKPSIPTSGESSASKHGSASKPGSAVEQERSLRETLRNFNAKALARDPIHEVAASGRNHTESGTRHPRTHEEDETATQAQYSSELVQRERGLCETRRSATAVG